MQIQRQDFVADVGRSFRRERAVRCFAQTGPPFSCLVADQTRLHLMADGAWVLEAWGYSGDDRSFRTVTREHADRWLSQNGFEGEAVVRAEARMHRPIPRVSGFVSAGDCAADLLDAMAKGYKNVG